MADAYTRVIIVHTAEHVRAALEAASGYAFPVALQSAPGAIAYAGALYLLHMFAQASAEFPKRQAMFILDCGEQAAEAIAAMEMGHTHIRVSVPEPLQLRLEDIARQHHITLVTTPFEALDLYHVRDAKAACRKWLAAPETPESPYRKQA